ncbi:MAG: C4-dicarboxylate ABC transporter permease, partial [Pseudolabrys sp.]|nr:C4-dicarboxylate ABC transporter permease [Pseudolabrys sp.]
AALAAAAQGWAIRRTTLVERLFFALSGLLLVFPGLLEALMETATGKDIPYPAPFGLALGMVLLLWQLKGPRPAGITTTG